jgi:signal transduction histidine kinase
VITAEVERINDTITRLLSYVRPYEPRLEPVDLRAMARDCVDLAAPRAAERRVSLALDMDALAFRPSGGRPRLDGGQIKQVVLNLLLNAVDASPPGGEVRLRVARDPHLELTDVRSGAGRLASGVVIEVRDHGPGFAPADAERIFQPFFSTKSSGTGLGLSISRKIVAAHGGEIRARCGGGETVFRVLLPVAPSGAAREEEAR